MQGLREVNAYYRFKLVPSRDQELTLASWANACRFVYNLGLEHRKLSWQQYRKSIDYHTQSASLPEMKATNGFEWLKNPPAIILQQTLIDLDKNFRSFFRNEKGYPNFKRKNSCNSFRLPSTNDFKVIGINKKYALLVLPKGLRIKFRITRQIPKTINNLTVKKERANWFVSFNCTKTIENKSSPVGKLGIDRGISNSYYCSNGEVFNLPKKVHETAKRIGVLQKRLSKKKLGSKNWKKSINKISKLHLKSKNIRNDFLHKTSTYIANNQGTIVLEDLRIKNMSKSAQGTKEQPGSNVRAKSGLNREILLQGWGYFANMLSYKSAWNNGTLIFVRPNHTSQKCHSCSFVSSDNRFKDRFNCLKCGYSEHADLNAAKNILTAGLAGSDRGDVGISLVDEAITSKAA